MLPRTVLVLGGAASGKSAYAESLFGDDISGCIYLATAQAFDDEMRAKIAEHIARRGPRWQTVEAPLDAAAALRALGGDGPCLFDCVSLWLSNHLLAESDISIYSTMREAVDQVVGLAKESKK